MKLAWRHTALSHSWWVALTSLSTSLAIGVGAFRPHCGLRKSVRRLIKGMARISFGSAFFGTTVCSETALLTMTLTSGMRPAMADMMKLVDPWQWMIAFISLAPVSRATVWMATGWS